MSDPDELAFQELERVYRDIETVRRSMIGWEMSREVMEPFLQSAFEAQFDNHDQFSRARGTAGAIEPFISAQAFVEFFKRLGRQPEFENTALFLYRHGYTGPREQGCIDSLADLDISPFGTAFNVTPIDTIIVPTSYFRGQPNEMLRVLNHISQRLCFVFVKQDDAAFRISYDELTDWLGREERLYVPVMPDMIPGFYRMAMPTGRDSWG